MAIEKISMEEAEKLFLLPQGRKHKVRACIEMMQPGEVLRISRADLTWKGRTPSHFCTKLQKKGKGKFKVLREGTIGWIVMRIE